MRLRAPLILLVSLAAAAAACGGDDSTSSTVPPPDTAADTGPTTTLPSVDLPSDPDAAVVTIDEAGIPAVTADGRVFARAEAEGALPLNDPTGALVTAQLTPAGLAQLMAKADELELLQTPPDYGDPGITDSGYLTVVLTTAEGTFEHSVYAPGEETGDADADAARERLDDFVDFINSLQTQLGDELGPWTPYIPEQWVVDPDAYVSSEGADPWPFDVDPAPGCTTFPLGGDSDTVSGVYVAAIEGRDQIVEVRPVLPFTDC